MLIDMHAHTSGISHCCLGDAERIVRDARAVRIDGILLTNHYCKSYDEGGDGLALAERYTEEYRHTKSVGEAEGLRVFFGIEVTMERLDFLHLVVLGVGEDFPLRHPLMFDYDLPALRRAVDGDGGLIIQAHPYRRYNYPLVDELIDGMELSCHKLYCGTHKDEILSLLRGRNKILTVGGDYHADAGRPPCGAYIPNEITDTRALASFLKEAREYEILIEEPWESRPTKIKYSKE
ncbi:MAG: PHP domain-containing protein [Clostridia bacterium]|nr:PHP domain-containing protein [Clostridia bacterium]